MQEFNQRGELTDLFTFRRVVSELGEGDVSFLRRTVGGVRRAFWPSGEHLKYAFERCPRGFFQ